MTVMSKNRNDICKIRKGDLLLIGLTDNFSWLATVLNEDYLTLTFCHWQTNPFIETIAKKHIAFEYKIL